MAAVDVEMADPWDGGPAYRQRGRLFVIATRLTRQVRERVEVVVLRQRERKTIRLPVIE